ncbi:MAG: phosphohydrolase [Alphaproteobacteria bacterium]|nr:phosphohydrolase [Alphaproteobacteria bacterium]
MVRLISRLSFILICCSFLGYAADEQQLVPTIFGPQKTDHPIVYALLDSKPMQRIKNVDQSGALYYFGHVPAYSRYDHSVGVWALLKMFESSVGEQVTGVLHDASHTAFSHTGDYLFGHMSKTNSYAENQHSYQDKIHLKFLAEADLLEILACGGLSLRDVDPDNGSNLALEQPLPDMCADRIEYNLHTGLLFNKITAEEIQDVIKDLRFDGKKWFFIDTKSALKLANLSLDFTKDFWGSDWNMVFNYYFSQILEKAISLGLIKDKSVRFGTDMKIFNVLVSSKDPYIQARMEACRAIRTPHTAFERISGDGSYDMYFKPKFRGIDPLVKVGTQLVRLSELDPTFAQSYSDIKDYCEKGFKVTLSVK